MINLDDTQLMTRIQDGQHAAFDVLVRRHTKYFYAVAYRRTGNQTMAEDITQQAFLKLWEDPKKFDITRGISFKTWFAQLVVNLCIDTHRKHKAPTEQLDDIHPISPDTPADMTLYRQQVMTFLADSLSHLPESQQIAIDMGFYQELPYEQVAKQMNTSVSAVKSLIVRAKENLKQLILERLS